MKSHPLSHLMTLVLVVGSLAAGEPSVPPNWTNTSGISTQGEFVKLVDNLVIIRKDGMEFKIPLAKLSPASREQARKLAAGPTSGSNSNRSAGLAPAPGSKPGPASDSRGKAVDPGIEFKVLLVIKRQSDAYSPLFLPVGSRMTDAEVAQVRRCFEVETPDMIRDVTGGKVRFVPTVVVSDKPLRIWDPNRFDSAEYYPLELLNEFSDLAKPGDFDSIGCYFLHYDQASGYRIPRAGFGVGGFDGTHGMGLFAVNCTPHLNPRDEIFLHEWMHGLDGFYGSKNGVKLPRGALHGAGDHGYREGLWRPTDTFRGWMGWYQDYLNGTVREGGLRAGLGTTAWKHGPMRLEAVRLAANYQPAEIPTGTYPAWVLDLMKGDLTHAKLGPELLESRLTGRLLAKSGWQTNLWNKEAGTKVLIDEEDGGTIAIHSPEPNDASVTRALPLKPFRNYIFTSEVRAADIEITEAGGRFGANLAAGDSVSTMDLTGTKPWTLVVLPFTTGAKPENCRVKLALGGSGSVARGSAFFRNVQVRQVGYPEFDLNPK